jgi:hypothetical protein
VIGPLIAALGFALFMLPGVNAGYWQTFFPAVIVLGTGMAVSVAPLTTTVMNSVAPNRVGIASGVNNAVARGAGLLAIAVLGIVMLHSFGHAIDRRLTEVNVPPAASQSLQAQRSKLAAASIPEDLDQITKQTIEHAISESFVHAFRLIMAIGATLAAVSAIVAWVLIGTAKQKEYSRPPKAFPD